MDQLTKKLYKRHNLCKLCNNHYGSDLDYDNGNCPVCIQKMSSRRSRLSEGQSKSKQEGK